MRIEDTLSVDNERIENTSQKTHCENRDKTQRKQLRGHTVRIEIKLRGNSSQDTL